VTVLAPRDWRWRAVDQQTERAIAALRRLPYWAYLRTSHWFRVKALALERAGHRCALCPSTTHLEVHHKSYARPGFEAPEDVVVLCAECHARHHRVLAVTDIRATDREPAKAPMMSSTEIRWLKNA
jgi:5-methylcytosine-specific restriction endonuclease McrA